MEKCSKCRQNEATECVFYSEYEDYLCKGCYSKWVKIEHSLPLPKKGEGGTYKTGVFRDIEREYIKWVKKEE